ncbi:MAG: NAD-dependent epimerase/dehydratase family protein [Roseibium sp.]
MDVFVTGGTGEIGSAIIRKLTDNTIRVIGLARSDASADKLRAAGANAFPGDLRNPESWVERAASCAAVIHAGATFTDDMGNVDRQAMLALKVAAKHRKQPLKLIYTGGIWLYPPTADGVLITEKTPFAPLPAFRFMTETIKTLASGTDLNLTIVHPSLVCSLTAGPIYEMTKALKDGVPFKTRAQPETMWPLVDADDLASLYMQSLKQSRFRLSLIASSIPGISVGHLASHISARHGGSLDIETETTPAELIPDLDWSAGYALSQTVDISQTQRVTGWAPANPTVEDLVLKLSK